MINVTNEADEVLREHLCSTVLGSNGVAYKHLHTRDKFHLLESPVFFDIRKGDKSIATVNYCRRTFENSSTQAYYIRYFAFNQSFRSSNTERRENASKGRFHRLMEANFENPGRFSPEHNESLPYIFYAFIEAKNYKSLQMSKNFGFEEVGEVYTHLFSRVFPKKRVNIEPLDLSQTPEVRQFLEGYFKGTFFDHLLHNGYWGLKMDDEVVISCGYQRCAWDIQSLGKGVKEFARKILPYLPYGKRIINPENHRFLAIEGLYVKEGYEDLLSSFFESLLEKLGYYHIMLWEDSLSSRNKALRKMKKGTVAKISGIQSVKVVARGDLGFFNDKRPLYCSGFDFT